jgi:hypothetical protein
VIVIGSKAKSMVEQRKKPAKLKWTQTWRRMHKKTQTSEIQRRKTRRAVKAQRAIVGASLEEVRSGSSANFPLVCLGRFFVLRAVRACVFAILSLLGAFGNVDLFRVERIRLLPLGNQCLRNEVSAVSKGCPYQPLDWIFEYRGLVAYVIPELFSANMSFPFCYVGLTTVCVCVCFAAVGRFWKREQLRKRRQAPRSAAQQAQAAKEVRERKAARKEAAADKKKGAAVRQPQNVQKGNVARPKGGR